MVATCTVVKRPILNKSSSELKSVVFITVVNLIDLTDHSFLPNNLVSMLTQFSKTGADGNYTSMFSSTRLFLVDLSLKNKIVIQLYCVRKSRTRLTRKRSHWVKNE